MDRNWNKELIKAEAVLLALGGVSNESLAEALDDKVPEIYVIGDAKKPGGLYHATHKGFHLGREI